MPDRGSARSPTPRAAPSALPPACRCSTWWKCRSPGRFPKTTRRKTIASPSGTPWRFRGRLGWNDLDGLLDRPAPLWENGHHSSCGHNDRVPPGAADDSLRLIRVSRFDLVITDDGKLRGRFRYLDTDYDLVVTDRWLSALRHRPPAIHRLTDVVLCVSLGEIFQDYCYKLVASLLYPKRFA